MKFQKGKIFNAKVSKIENFGLFLDLGLDKKGFLSKDAMNVSKKKKLKDIFSEGYIITATLISEKKDYYTLTQKENLTEQIENKKIDTKDKKTQKLKNNIKQTNNNKNNNKALSNEIKENKEKNNKLDKEIQNITLKDLKKLNYIGNLKITKQKTKKEKKEVDVFEEKEDVVCEILDVPENFIENMEADIEFLNDKFEKIKKELFDGGFLNEN